MILPEDMTSTNARLDLLMGRRKGHFAIFGERKIIIALPRPPDDIIHGGAQSAVLSYCDSDENSKYIDRPATCKFSLSGNKVALLHDSSTVMYVWDLNKGVRQTVVRQDRSKREFCSFALSQKGEVLAICRLDGTIGLWDLNQDKPAYLEDISGVCIGQSRVPSSGGPCIAMVILDEKRRPQAMEIVVCSNTGELCWIAVEESCMAGSQSTIHPLRSKPFFKSVNGTLIKPKDWKLVGTLDVRQAEARIACHFNASGSTAIVICTPKKVAVWDLLTRERIKTLDYSFSLASNHIISPSRRVTFSGEQAVALGLNWNENEVVVNRYDEVSDGTTRRVSNIKTSHLESQSAQEFGVLLGVPQNNKQILIRLQRSEACCGCALAQISKNEAHS